MQILTVTDYHLNTLRCQTRCSLTFDVIFDNMSCCLWLDAWLQGRELQRLWLSNGKNKWTNSNLAADFVSLPLLLFQDLRKPAVPGSYLRALRNRRNGKDPLLKRVKVNNIPEETHQSSTKKQLGSQPPTAFSQPIVWHTRVGAY